MTVQTLGVREPDDFDTAFAAMTPEMPDGIFMVTDALTALNCKRVSSLLPPTWCRPFTNTSFLRVTAG